MGLLFILGGIGLLTAWAFGRKSDPTAIERTRTVGNALREVSRVQGLGPLGGANPDLGPPPPDPVDDDHNTIRWQPPKPEDGSSE